VIDVGDRMETIVRMMASHRSQFFEWLPYNERRADEVPQAEADRIAWLRRWYEQKIAPLCRAVSGRAGGPIWSDRGRKNRYCEVFEISEYAAPSTSVTPTVVLVHTLTLSLGKKLNRDNKGNGDFFVGLCFLCSLLLILGFVFQRRSVLTHVRIATVYSHQPGPRRNERNGKNSGQRTVH